MASKEVGSDHPAAVAAVEAGLGAAADLGRKVLGAEDALAISKSRSNANPISHKEEWSLQGEAFVELFYNTAPNKLHELYDKDCDVTWQVLDDSRQMISSEEVQKTIALSVHQPSFSLKYHLVRKIERAIQVVARGVYTANRKSFNFFQSFILHRHRLKILNEVLLVVSNVPLLRFKVKTAGSMLAERKFEGAGDETQTFEVLLVYNPECLEHIPPEMKIQHPENPDRIRNILTRISLQASESALQKHVLSVHSEKYVSAAVDKLPLTAEEQWQ